MVRFFPWNINQLFLFYLSHMLFPDDLKGTFIICKPLDIPQSLVISVLCLNLSAMFCINTMPFNYCKYIQSVAYLKGKLHYCFLLFISKLFLDIFVMCSSKVELVCQV